MSRLFLFLFLLGQNRLQHIAGFGDMREIDFRRNRRSTTA